MRNWNRENIFLKKGVRRYIWKTVEFFENLISGLNFMINYEF